MKTTQRFCLGLLLCCLTYAASPCQAQTWTTRSHTRYLYGKFGNLLGIHVTMQIHGVPRIYHFTLDAKFLSLPFATQMTLLARQHRLGQEATIIAQVLSGIEQQLQQQLTGGIP